MREKRDSSFPREGDYPGSCTVCGRQTSFSVFKENRHLRETFICKHCGSMARHRHLALVLSETFGVSLPGEITGLKVYNAESSGPIHNVLKQHPGYTYSEFSQTNKGVRYEDLQQLSFADNSFDLVITQDVFEHIRKPMIAWQEIHRVLKPAGYHIFTIPCSKRIPTIPRVEVSGVEDIFIKPKVYHGEPTRDRLLYNNFGNDLAGVLEKQGFATQVFWHDDLDRERFRIYAGAVFVSRKR
ncbi:MAG: class I SAM-dependent methyltransferase [Candidatus Margulisiibacteriota bacterium]